jgi:putative chitinase
VPNERYFLEQPDGEEKKGTLDEQGKAMCEVPPGPSKALFPDVGEAARPSASSTPSTSESRPADDAPEATPPPDDEPAPAPAEETSESFSVTAGELERIWPEANPADIERFTGPLNETLRRYGMDTPLRAAHFLAQVGHESKMLQGLEEDFYYRPGRVSEVFPNGRNGYSAEELETKARQGERALANALYGGDSRNLGNTQEGDGWRFRGRGLIHLTGRGNYEEYGAHQDMNLTSNPEKVAEPYLAADVAGWYFENRVPYDLMDQDDVVGVSAAVNYPRAVEDRSYVDQINGLDDRKAILRRAKRALSA